jgi:hypothetical protein
VETFITAVLAGAIGAFLGFWFRSWEFRREQRLRVYGEYVAAFMRATRVGASLGSLSMSFGETLHTDPERRKLLAEYQGQWADALFGFEDVTARLRLIASKRVREATEELDRFIESNIKATPPLCPGAERDTSGWGEAAKIGPSKVESEGVRIGHEFADKASRDVVFARGR